ncbi:hypothetical protein B0920_02865 [Massilia sp. KIM]|uniref:DUF4214 domain-containing protein n=1 Tax=Massilia sp. KIM TaxID=1955422 RepID=UPI0009D3DC96|nr:DUF4214 domain-containing protein [Massilia sp. KIM]OON62424.1 hypothetical protein B0920_02865 [Massilia sp. KIM]
MYTATLVSRDLSGHGLTFEGRPIRAEFSFAGTPLPNAVQARTLDFWLVGGASGVGNWSNGGHAGSFVATYTPTQADVGKSVSAVLHLYYGDATYVAMSDRTLSVINVNDLPTGSVRIVGDTRSAGSVLTAVSSIADEDGMGTLSYEWRADGQLIAGASAATLTLGQGEAGKNITVVAKYVDGGGQAESVASDADPSLKHINTPGVTTLSGAIAPGQKLHIEVVDPDHQGNVYHRWQVADASGAWRDVEGAGLSDFTLGAELPSAVRVLTAYADRYGVVESWSNTIGSERADRMTVGDYYSDTDVVETRGGDDFITRGIGLGNRIDGGEGLDTFVTAETRFMFGKSALAGYWEMQSITTGLTSFYVKNVERVHFQNGADGVALDYQGNAGQAYRLYQAAFDRTPDKVGQGFWMARLDQGMSLLEIANAFVGSNEFKTLYGANPTNAGIVAQFYRNVLDREPDAQSQFWVDALDSKRATVAEVLVGFSESAENVAALVGVADRGIDFTPYTG